MNDILLEYIFYGAEEDLKTLSRKDETKAEKKAHYLRHPAFPCHPRIEQSIETKQAARPPPSTTVLFLGEKRGIGIT